MSNRHLFITLEQSEKLGLNETYLKMVQYAERMGDNENYRGTLTPFDIMESNNGTDWEFVLELLTALKLVCAIERKVFLKRKNIDDVE